MAGPTGSARLIGYDRFIPQQNDERIMLLGDRFDRASAAHAPWAKIATECTDFFEGRQWTAADLARLATEKRPAIVLNMIKPIVMLVLGLFSQNRTNIKYAPGIDDTGNEAVAEILNKISKNIDQFSQSQYVDGEWFMDGLFTGRGFIRTLLDQSKNYYGQVKDIALDPFSVLPDPDGSEYDLNKSGFIFFSRWLSLGDIKMMYPKEAYEFMKSYIGAGAFHSITTAGYYFGGTSSVKPPTRFGGNEVGPESPFGYGYDRFFNYVDPQQKTIRLLECEHHVTIDVPHFVDLETGDMEIVPDDWDRDKIVQVLERSLSIGNPLRVVMQKRNKVRWSQMLGDLLVYDDWSLYENFSITGYFPYFRRGQTQGMIESLLDPQRELNKRHASRLNILIKMVNSGFIYDKDTLDQEMREKIEQHGSKPGIHIAFDSKGGTRSAPKNIDPPVMPEEFKRLELESEDKIKKISGVNDSAMGQLDVAQSGRAIESRQRQALVGIEPYLLNYKRSKTLIGERRLEIVQRYYREARIMRIIGDDGKPVTFEINVHQAATGTIVNDVTVGRYITQVDESPLSATFLEAQFNEAMVLREKGVPIPDDIMLELSSLGKIPQIQQRVQMVRAQMGLGDSNIPASATGAMPPTAGPGGAPAPTPPPRPEGAQQGPALQPTMKAESTVQSKPGGQ